MTKEKPTPVGTGMSLIAGIGGFKLKGTKAGQLLDLIFTSLMVMAFLNSPQGRKMTAAGLTLAAKKLREKIKNKRSGGKKLRKRSGIKKGAR